MQEKMFAISEISNKYAGCCVESQNIDDTECQIAKNYHRINIYCLRYGKFAL